MSKEKTEITSEDRIVSFPSETLKFCRDIVSQIVKRKGETSVPFKEISIILGKPFGTLTLPISTCVQYGVLENIFGKGYKVTDLYNKIETPVYESDRNKAILDALSNAPLYKALINEFNGKILPDEQGMTNYLVKTFGIKSYLIQKVVKVFFRNFRDYDLIDNNSRLRFLLPLQSIKQNENNGSGIGSEDPPPPPPPNDKMFDQAIDLGGVDTAYLKYPRNITSLQIAMLRIHLEATLTALEARQKIKNESEQ
jgi:hypothetical protein